MSRLSSLLDNPRAVPAICFTALCLSLVYCYLVYPFWSSALEANIDPDWWGKLGHGLWRRGVLGYPPEFEPVVYRAPLYAMLIAGVLWLTGGAVWPHGIQLVQCLLFAGTCLLTYTLARDMFGRRTGVLACLACAVHPFLIWYTSRLWVESFLAFLFVLLANVLVRCLKDGRWRWYLAAGVVLGLCALTKSTFLPYFLLMPVALVVSGGKRFAPRAGVLALTACCVVAPWTLRNYGVTGRFIPVHVGAGVNLAHADCVFENFWRSPFAHTSLGWSCWDDVIKPVERTLPDEMSNADRMMSLDGYFMDQSKRKYREHPGFLIRKMAFNSVMFWVFSGSRVKSAVLAVLQLPVLFLAAWGAAGVVRRHGWRSWRAVMLVLPLVYYLEHLPINAVARYSAVLLPMLLAYAARLPFRREA